MARTSVALESGVANEASQLERANNETNSRTLLLQNVSLIPHRWIITDELTILSKYV